MCLLLRGGKGEGQGWPQGGSLDIWMLVIFRLHFLLIIISRQKNSAPVLSALLLSSEECECGGQALAGKAALKLRVVLGAGVWAKD